MAPSPAPLRGPLFPSRRVENVETPGSREAGHREYNEFPAATPLVRSPEVLASACDRCLVAKHPSRPHEIVVHTSDVQQLDALRANRLTFTHVCAGPENLRLHLRRHGLNPPVALRLTLG